jgi:beta-glucosidase
VRLARGAGTTVSFELTPDDLASFDENSGAWGIHDGPYEILIGRSSRNLPVSAGLEIRAGKITSAAIRSR